MTKKISNADEPTWGLFYRENTKDMDARKSIKVKLPIRQHIKLHALKLFTEKNISETVEKALDSYFSDMKDAEGGPLSEGAVSAVGGRIVNGDVAGTEVSADALATGENAGVNTGVTARVRDTNDTL